MSAIKCICVISLMFGLTTSLPITQDKFSSGQADEIHLSDITSPATESFVLDHLDAEISSDVDKNINVTDIVQVVNEVSGVDSNIFNKYHLDAEISSDVDKNITVADIVQVVKEVSGVDSNVFNKSEPNNIMRNQIRPGMIVSSYAIEITPDVNGGTFSGRLVAQVVIEDPETREDPVMFYVRELSIDSVVFSLAGGSTYSAADFFLDEDEGLLEIYSGIEASLYTFVIEYRGTMSVIGQALYAGHYDSINYLAMNLHPTNARRVFPCMDEPTEVSIISFTFNNIEYNNLIANSLLEENSQNQFRALQGPPHLWTMAAHNLNNINVPTSNVLLYVRPGVSNQESQASVAINYFFNTLNEWTNKPYFEIIVNQNSQLSVLALPDVSVDFYGLSMVGLWEPYILMETSCSIKQRYQGLVKMAEALSKQWFGYVIYPENWRYEWVVSGLAEYAAYDILKTFQVDTTGIDTSLLDVNTLFVTEVIQESLLRDSYTSAQILEPDEDLFDEDVIRDNINGISQYKAPAIMWMLRTILGDQDFIQAGGRALIAGRALQTVNSMNFVDAIRSDWLQNGNGIVDEIDEYLEPWIKNNGCPLIHVGLRQGGVLVTQERFGFTSQSHVGYNVPITFTVSTNPNFDNLEPVAMMEGTMTFNMVLQEDPDEEGVGDFVLFNLQGQGYYRVNYDNELWQRIISALNDPDQREQIHPLNRATLIDDSLNLARAGRIDYEIALQVALSMEHETEYAPWKAYIRNMNFLRKRLVAFVSEDEDEELDPDIYLRMVRRGIVAFESEIGFTPEVNVLEPAMVSLTRGLVMDHACRANYEPCIAAAVDWFWDPNSNEPVVNPNIPADIRPAVYCTMVREGEADVINALHDRLAIEPSLYERTVILESLTCSRDGNYVRTLLEETIATNGPYTAEEKVRIFTAAAESSYENAWVALSFISMRSNEIRAMYGGQGKLEEVIFALAENMADFGLTNDFNVWVYAQNNNLEDSQFTAERAAAMAMENQEWENNHMEYVYEWIDENDAPTLIVSSILILGSCLIALLNH